MMKRSELPMTNNLLTLGQIGDRIREDGIKVNKAQLKYALDAYAIEPAGRVGILRVWTVDDIPRIKSALARIAVNRRWGF